MSTTERTRDEHDHGPKARLLDEVWCLSCEHTHIASIPVVTFRCADCGFGAWGETVAESHATSWVEHVVYPHVHRIAEHQPTAREGIPVPPDRAADEDWRPPCRDCGPGYRVGDEGCRHDHSGVGREYEPETGETGICRTCAQPIWWEAGEVGHRECVGWSDRIKRGGDSLVCFKAVGYRHVPMGAREEAIYRAGVKAGKEADHE